MNTQLGRHKASAADKFFGQKKRRKKRSKKKCENYGRYLRRLCQIVNQKKVLSKEAMETLNFLVDDIFCRLTSLSKKLVQKTCRRTLQARDIETAVKLIVPGTLGEYSVNEGRRAVQRCFEQEWQTDDSQEIEEGGSQELDERGCLPEQIQDTSCYQLALDRKLSRTEVFMDQSPYQLVEEEQLSQPKVVPDQSIYQAFESKLNHSEDSTANQMVVDSDPKNSDPSEYTEPTDLVSIEFFNLSLNQQESPSDQAPAIDEPDQVTSPRQPHEE